MKQKVKKHDLQQKLVQFSVLTIEVGQLMLKHQVGKHLAVQIIRSGTSVSVNYEEAKNGESLIAFICKIQACLNELRQIFTCLKAVTNSSLGKEYAKIEMAQKQSIELIAVFVKDIEIAQFNLKNEHETPIPAFNDDKTVGASINIQRSTFHSVLGVRCSMFSVHKPSNSNSKLRTAKLSAFTLTELLIVLVIIGILVLLALPNLMPKVSETKAQEAKLQLNYLFTLEKTHFMMNSKYATQFDDIGFEHAKLTSDGGTANYHVEIIEATNHGFVATATAITDFDGDGVLNKWEINEQKQLKEIQKD